MKVQIGNIAFFFWALFVSQSALGQEITIKLGADEVAFNEEFKITVTVNNGRLKSYDNFPDIEGFIKRGTSSASSTNIINGQISSSQSITQNYIPEKEGIFIVPSFKMRINGEEISVPGKKVKVGPEKERRDPFRDPFKDMFDSRSRRQAQDYIDVEEDAFIAFTTDKNEVYVGEGFVGTLAFYVAESNRAPLQFHELGKQLSEILKKLKPTSCWEENFNIENINGEPITLNNKRYTQYKIYQAAYYPLNLEPIDFPSVGLEMIKYKVAKNPSFFGRNRQEDFKTFYSRPRSIKVKELPPHPMRDQVAVGNFRLEERISQREVMTGQSFNYEFSIYGEGNISAINNPIINDDGNFEFYDPNVAQNINRRNNRVTGSKSFNYFIIPAEPGEYNLKDYFQWVYFNPSEEVYDTITANVEMKAFGESKKNQSIIASDLGEFYDRIGADSNVLEARSRFDSIKTYANIVILLMLILVAAFIFKK